MDSIVKEAVKKLGQVEVLRQILGEETERLIDVASMLLSQVYRDFIFLEKMCMTGKHLEAAEKLQKATDLLDQLVDLEDLGREELERKMHPEWFVGRREPENRDAETDCHGRGAASQ